MRRGRSIKEEDGQAQQQAAGEALWPPANSISYTRAGKSILDRYSCAVLPLKSSEGPHRTTNNTVRTALITGLLIHTRILEQQYRRKRHRRPRQGGRINRRASTVIYKLSTRQHHLGTQQGEIGQVQEKQVSVWP